MKRRYPKRRQTKSSRMPPVFMCGSALILLIMAVFLLGYEHTIKDIFMNLASKDDFTAAVIGMELSLPPDTGRDKNSYDSIHIMDRGKDEDISFDYVVDESEFIPENISKNNTKLKPISELTIAASDDTGYDSAQGVYIKNDTKKQVNVDSMLKKPYKCDLLSKEPTVLIVHTHGSEAYTPDGKNMYTPDDNDRSLNRDYNVMRVGSEIESVLKNMGIGVIHIQEFFDSPTYNGSYTRSLEAVSKQMKKTPSIKMVLDVHRDSMIASNGTKYKTNTQIGEQKAAQIMLVIGTDEGGLKHDNWQTNLNYAVNLQKRINKKYPTLMRPINLRKSRFNQHTTKTSMILEVGSSGNTLDEAVLAAHTFAYQLGNTILGK